MRNNRSFTINILTNMTNTDLECIKTRRSIRRYKPEQIKDEELQSVLEAGTFAPTGMGYQDPWIVAVQNKEIIAQLTEMNKKFYEGAGDPYYGAPTIVLVFGSSPEKWRNSTNDGSLVLGNMMIAAHSIGLGSCWINREREMFATDEGKALMKQMGLPDGLVGIGSIALGYPASYPPTVKPRKDGYARVIR